MRKNARLLVAAICTCALVGTCALFGCSAPQKSTDAQPTDAKSSASQDTAQHQPVTLQIFAANSLSKAMDEVQDLYKKDHSWVSFADTQYEGSGTLNEMLGAGSYADILITASKGTMDTAVDSKYVDPSTRFDMFTNDLVLVSGDKNTSIPKVELGDLASGKYTVSVGDANVPAGNYAKQSLSTTNPACWVSSDGKIGKDSSGKEGTFDGTPLAGKVTEGSSVGNVCSYANSGDVDVAMVYSSDVYRFGGVKILSTVPADTHKKIVYPAAITTQSKYADESKKFLDWAFKNEDALKIWQKWGFELAS